MTDVRIERNGETILVEETPAPGTDRELLLERYAGSICQNGEKEDE